MKVHEENFSIESVKEGFRKTNLFPFQVSDAQIAQMEEFNDESYEILRNPNQIMKCGRVYEILDQMKALNKELSQKMVEEKQMDLVKNTNVIGQQLELLLNACGRI